MKVDVWRVYVDGAGMAESFEDVFFVCEDDALEYHGESCYIFENEIKSGDVVVGIEEMTWKEFNESGQEWIRHEIKGGKDMTMIESKMEVERYRSKLSCAVMWQVTLYGQRGVCFSELRCTFFNHDRGELQTAIDKLLSDGDILKVERGDHFAYVVSD